MLSVLDTSSMSTRNQIGQSMPMTFEITESQKSIILNYFDTLLGHSDTAITDIMITAQRSQGLLLKYSLEGGMDDGSLKDSAFVLSLLAELAHDLNKDYFEQRNSRE